MRTPPFFARLLHVLALILLSGLFVLGTGCVHNNDPWYDDPPPPRQHRQPPPPHNRVQPNKPAAPGPLWLPARNRATGTTSPCRSMTAATTGGILPRAADVLCGSSPELPHFSFPAASGYRARPGQLRTPPARALRAPPATGGEDFGRTKIFPAMTHLYKIFFAA